MPTTRRVDYSFGPDRHFIITSQCTPVREDETEVYTVVTYRYGRIGPLIRLLFQPMARTIIRQDVAILAAQSDQLCHFGGAQFTFVETDLLAPHIWQLWQRALAPPDPGSNGASPEEPSEATEEVLLRF
jgi:hypothetical protein